MIAFKALQPRRCVIGARAGVGLYMPTWWGSECPTCTLFKPEYINMTS